MLLGYIGGKMLYDAIRGDEEDSGATDHVAWGVFLMLAVATSIDAFAVGISFAALTVLAAWRGRLFCNTVCPVGAVLGLLSAKAPFKIRLDAAKCVKCGLCAKACKAECIDVANGTVDQSRCVRCFNCLGACKKGAMSWK